MLQPLCGYVLDVFGLKLGFALFAIGLVDHQHGARPGAQLGVAVLARGLLGLAEGSANPAGMKATSEWFPAHERGLAGGVFNIGASVGSMLAPPLVAWAIIAHSWQSAFVLTGALGLVWVCCGSGSINRRRRTRGCPERNATTSVPGRRNICRVTARARRSRRSLRQRNFWGIALPRFLADPTWGTLTFWLPLYLTTVRHFDLKQIALFAWLPFLAADFGCVVRRRDQHGAPERRRALINARRGAFTVGACLMMGVAFVGFVRESLRRGRAAQPGGIRAPDAVGHGHHDGVGPVPAERGRDRRRHGRHLRQRRRAHLLAADRLAGHDGRLHAVLRRPWRARSPRRGRSLDRGARAGTAAPHRPRAAAPDAMPARTLCIRNPILPGFNPDPSIVRVGDDYYIATSTFEWFPGVQIHHSRDLVHWRLLTRPLSRASQLNMLGDPDSCGVWAPCLTLRRRPVLSDLHRRETLRPHVAARRRRRVAARLPQLSRHQPAHRWRVVRSGLPQQQRLRSVALSRRRRPQVSAQHAVGSSARAAIASPASCCRNTRRASASSSASARRSSKARRSASPKAPHLYKRNG